MDFPQFSALLYETDFSTDVSADWALHGAVIVAGNGMDVSGGWGVYRRGN